MTNFIQFEPAEIIAQLKSLDPESKPNWGVMTPQHLVEHLIVIFKISNGSIPSELYIDEASIPERLKFLRSDREFQRNIRIKNLPKDEPMPLRMASMEAAIDKLEKEIHRFEATFAENPDQIIVHPMFGPLGYQDWVQFHRKHTTHHFKQFGLLD